MPPQARRSTLLRDLALFAVLFVGISAWQSRKVVRGEPVSLSGPGLRGEALSAEALRGHPAIVHFWATWCGVCRAEEGTIARLATEAPMITVASSSGSASQVEAVLRERGITLPTLVDPEGTLAARFGVGSFPTTLILDSSGKVSWVSVGYTTTLGLKLRYWLTR